MIALHQELVDLAILMVTIGLCMVFVALLPAVFGFKEHVKKLRAKATRRHG